MLVNVDASLPRRVRNRWRRYSIERFGRRLLPLRNDVAYVSFSFDDFPRTALHAGGRILEAQGVRGTYFVSLGLLGMPSPSGSLASVDDLKSAVASGHELGCHTFEHLDGTKAHPRDFERSIAANRQALHAHGLESELAMFAYPLDGPTLAVKRVVGRYFAACRGGGQTFNAGEVDLNLLKAHFLDRRNGVSLDALARLIEQNAAARGWLVFATHDVVANPSPYGCEPGYLEAVVRLAIASGAKVLPMGNVVRELGFTTGPRRESPAMALTH